MPGLNYALSDVSAAIGIHQLAKLPAFIGRRAEIAARYTRAFADVPGLVTPTVVPAATMNWFLYALLVDPCCGVDRDSLLRLLADRGIATSIHFPPVHTLSYYRRHFPAAPGRLPVTTRIGAQEISIPCYPAMTDEQVERVIDAVTDIVTDRASRPRATVGGPASPAGQDSGIGPQREV